MSEDKSKGQVSLIDILILGIFVSILLILTMYSGKSIETAQVTREEALYAQSALLSLMNYRNETYGTYDNSGTNLTFGEALDMFFCYDDKLYTHQLNVTAKGFLDRVMKPGYNYVFFTVDENQKGIHVWKGQHSVCARYITIKTIELALTCGKLSLGPTLFMWPEWKKVPLAEECP